MKRLRIHHVEDDDVDARLFQEAVDACLDLEITTIRHRSSEEAIAYIQHALNENDLPDVLFLDLRMPGGSGLDVLREVRAINEANVVPVIVLTTSSHPSDVSEALRLIVTGYLVKPVEAEELLSVIKKAIDWVVLGVGHRHRADFVTVTRKA